MRKWNKVLALILAVVLALSNLPPVWAAAEEPADPLQKSPGMRLRQTGFDEDTGILTMTLEIRPSLLGVVWQEEEFGEVYDCYKGRFVNMAYLAFQVDPLSVMPITADGTAINAGSDGKIGFVGIDRSIVENDTSGSYPVWQKFMNQREGGRGQQYGQGFNSSMGTTVLSADGQPLNVFAENYSGYFTSYNREESGLMDCYLHLRWTANWKTFETVTDTVDVNGNPLEDGYVKAIDLKFQCYSGDVSMDGTPSKATSADALFANSIRLPIGVGTDAQFAARMTKQEMEELRDQFYANTMEETRTYLSTGLAGFRESDVNASGNFKNSWNYYAYDDNDMKPRDTDFNVQTSQTNLTPMGDPELSYTNMDKEFIVLSFEGRLDNTYEFGEENTGTADFYIPSDTGKYPRYAIPYRSEMEAMEEAEKRDHLWKPKAQFQDENVELKYYLTTHVSASSTKKPEVKDAGAFDSFLENLTWNFALLETSDGNPIPLDTYYNNNALSDVDPLGENATEAQPEEITLYSDKYLSPITFEVRQKYIKDPSSNYYGCKVQTVQEILGKTPEGENILSDEVHVTPMGIMFDFSYDTPITYQTMEKESNGSFKDKETTGYAPQLRISAKAADARSYLWLGTLDSPGNVAARRGDLYVTVDYTDSSGGVFAASNFMRVRLYKDEERTPAYTQISVPDAEVYDEETSQFVTKSYRDPEKPDDENAYLIDVATHDAMLSGAGIMLNSAIFDQYGDDMFDASGNLRLPEIEITATEETQKAIEAAGGVNALGTRFDSISRAYYLIYGNNAANQPYGANDLIAGEYVISAVYEGVKEPATCILRVTKDPNKFRYMDSEIALTSDTITTPQGLVYGEVETKENGERIQELRLRVPPRIYDEETGEFVEQNVTVQFDLLELANQWRNPDSSFQTGGPAFDVLPDLHDQEGNWNQSVLDTKFAFEYEWSNADGSVTAIEGVDTSSLARTGTFTYSSAAGNGTFPGAIGGSTEGSPMHVTVKARRVDGDEDEVQTNKYRIYFVRDTRLLTTIKARYDGSTPGKEVTANLSVPEEGKTERAHVEFLAYDQYDSPLNWSDLQATYGQQWEMFIDRSSMKDASGKQVTSLPGVSLVDLNSSYIQLTDDAEPCEFDVYAVSGGMDTSRAESNNHLRQVVHVVVTKRPSVPARVQSITQGIIEIEVPNIEDVAAAVARGEGEAVNTGGPKIVVVDQYGDEMVDGATLGSSGTVVKEGQGVYFARWGFAQLPPDPRITINASTGVVSVASNEEGCAPAWDNVTMTVRLYSAVESPAGSGRYVQGEWMSNITVNTTYTGLRVVRNANPTVTELEITTKSLEYPVQQTGTQTVNRVAPLGAIATTEYGASTPLKAGDAIWILENVEYADGTKAAYREPVLDAQGNQLYDEIDDGGGGVIRIPRWSTPNPTEVEYSATASTYTDIARKVLTLEQNRAQFRFGNSITNADWAPVAVTVTCQYSNETATVRLPITYSGETFSPEIRRPTSVSIVNREEIQVPKSTEPNVEVVLDAVVKDQFGFIINGEGASNAPCKWEFVSSLTGGVIDAPVGVSIVDNKLLVVDSRASENGSVFLRATYTQGGYSASGVQEIGLLVGPSVPTLVELQGIEEIASAEDKDSMERTALPLPGFTGPAEDENGRALSNAQDASYTLKAVVKNGYHASLTSRTVKWTVVDNPYYLATISDNNKLTIQCTQEWINANRPAEVKIKLRAADSDPNYANDVWAEVTLTITRQNDYGAYAMPKLVKVPAVGKDWATWPVYTDNADLAPETYLLVPSMERYNKNGEKPYEAHFEAEVFSQYREKLSLDDPMEALVEISFRNPANMSSTVTGLRMESEGNGKGVLYINPNVEVSMTHLLVVAKPTDYRATLDTSINKCDIYFDAGASYPAGVALGTDYFDRPDPIRVEDVPVWDPGEDPNIPDFSGVGAYSSFVLNAFVHDQRGSDYEGFNVGNEYPVWKLPDNVPAGVSFENPTDDPSLNNVFDADGNPYGKTLRIWVSSETLGQNVTEGTFDVIVWANGHLEEGGDFIKTQTIRLIKGVSQAKHIYFQNVLSTDETDGAGLGEGIVRPGIGDPSVTVPVSAMVFDAYGNRRDDIATSIVVRESVLPEKVTVEPLLSEDGTRTIGQRIMRGDLVMADFTAPVNGRGSGSLTVYTACNLDAIELQLTCGQLADSKILRLPIIQQEKVATTAVLYDGETEEPVDTSDIIFNRSSEDGIAKEYYVVIFDQYGDPVSEELAKTIIPVWTVNAPGEENGTWVEYTEVDKEGNPVDEQERFLRWRDSSDAKTMTLLVEPSKYKKALTLRLTCTLMTADGELLPISIPGIALSIRKRSSNSFSSAGGAYIVTYFAGAHGTLVGTVESETVLEGTTPKLVPDVIADSGYAHRGWDMYGELIDDPSTLEVYSDIELVAQYIKLSDVAFVSGYQDNTVRPLSDITRGEFTRMLVGALTNYDPETHAKYANPFDDVGENRYYRDYIAYAYFYGIVTGYEDGTFRPEDPITRAEAAGMIAKAKNISRVSGVTVFTDLNPDSWYVGYVEALGRLEILHGYGDGTFRPANHLTRAEAVTMLVRISDAAPSEREIEAIRRSAEVPFGDLDRKYWAMPYILRAAGIA